MVSEVDPVITWLGAVRRNLALMGTAIVAAASAVVAAEIAVRVLGPRPVVVSEWLLPLPRMSL